MTKNIGDYKCPGCSGAAACYFTVTAQHMGVWETIPVFTCGTCGGIFTGDLPLLSTAVSQLVDYSEWDSGNEDSRYFDFMVKNPFTGETSRLHGWYNSRTKLIQQTG